MSTPPELSAAELQRIFNEDIRPYYFPDNQPIATRPIGCLLLKGKNNTLPVSTLESTLDPLACCPVEDYQNIMQCLQGSVAATPNEIKKKLERLSRHYPHDPLIQLHHQRIQQGALDDRVILSAP